MQGVARGECRDESPSLSSGKGLCPAVGVQSAGSLQTPAPSGSHLLGIMPSQGSSLLQRCGHLCPVWQSSAGQSLPQSCLPCWGRLGQVCTTPSLPFTQYSFLPFLSLAIVPNKHLALSFVSASTSKEIKLVWAIHFGGKEGTC